MTELHGMYGCVVNGVRVTVDEPRYGRCACGLVQVRLIPAPWWCRVMTDKDPALLQIYSDPGEHGAAYVVANTDGLRNLISACVEALASGKSMTSGNFANDGEGFHLFIVHEPAEWETTPWRILGNRHPAEIYHEDNGPFPRAEIRDAAKRERGKRALLPAAEAAVDDFDTIRENVRNGLNDGRCR